ncbi:integrase catalytic domain-containing protein [Trichonephila clavipes]|nr:integrase catalytic domain-containing protein [Trichonephila clavipes]
MHWGHCPGKDNPADLFSRGTSAVKFGLCSEELEHRSSVHVAVTQQREALVDINRFSSLKKLLKTTAWVFRFVNNVRNIYKSMDFYITADEIQNAEYFWLKCVQSEFYSAEILALKQNEQLRSSSEIKSLVPYLDENNLLRLTGWLLEADLCFGEKHPVIHPRRCKFTELLVIREHERIGHCGVSATLTQLRKKYWVPKGRQLVKTMIRICLVCKKYSAKPADQLSGQLPRDRITQSPPFQSVGIDFTDKGIHWKFIVESAPWWGGFYERLVKTIKDPLRKILGRALLTFEELSTILSEVEVIVNHRPLTYVENDPGEPEPLTPAHFLELGYVKVPTASAASKTAKRRKNKRATDSPTSGDAGKKKCSERWLPPNTPSPPDEGETLSMEEDISSDDSSEATKMTKDVSPAGASRSGITANGNAPSSKDYDSDSFTEVTRKKRIASIVIKMQPGC